VAKRASSTKKAKRVSKTSKTSRRSKRRQRTSRHLCDSYVFTGIPIDELDLVEYAKSGAQVLLDEYPDTIFTSGRRNSQQQADAMAPNIVKDRQWIKKTYALSSERDSLQKWVDDNSDATTAADISAGLKSIMDTWSDTQKGAFSKHFGGQAFDVQPVDDSEVKNFIQNLDHLHKFFDNEGGLTIWHADFKKPTRKKKMDNISFSSALEMKRDSI
jgi:hypothetical protein